MKIIDLIRTLRFIGWENPYRAVIYSLMRDRQERRISHKRATDAPPWLSPGELVSASPIRHGAHLEFARTQLEILFLDEQVVRVSWSPGEPPVPYAIQDRYWPGASTSLSESGSIWKINTGVISANINPSGGIDWYCKNEPIRREDPPLRTQKAWLHQTTLPELSAVYGLGGRTSAVNLRGGSYRLWNRDPGGSYGRGDDPLYLTIPTMLILQNRSSYVIFYENSFDGSVSIDELLSVQFEDGMLRYYLCFGGLPEALERYSQLTGKPHLPPYWSLGFHQSRWGYRSAQDIEALLGGFRQHDLPLSALHLDIDYMDGYRVFTVDPHRFPNLKELSKKAEGHGVKLVTIIDPGVKIDRGYRLYREGIQAGLFCKTENERFLRAPVWPGWVHFPDFTDPGTRRWWQRQYPRLLNQGISGIWHDMNEPAAFTAWGDPSLPLTTRHTLEGQGGQHTQAHNFYGLLMNRAGWQALRDYLPEQRPFLLSRSGWAGNQRYAWNWTGDVESTWDGLRVTLAVMLGMSLSGIPFTGSDIGGFSGDPTPELMLRWMQLAVFTPFFRTHSAVTSIPREPWRYENPFRQAMRQMLHLRYRLLPYLYTQAWRTSITGLPLLRPLFWAQPSNPDYWNCEDQFFSGPDMLIAPVLEAGAEERDVTFPPGRWYSLWDNTRFNGPARITVATPLNQIPAFVRAGCVLPLIGEHLELHVYPDSPGEQSSVLYSDAGDGFGSYRLDHFDLVCSQERIDLRCRPEGQFSTPYPSREVYLHDAEPVSISIDGKRRDPEVRPFEAEDFRHIEFEL